MGHAEKKPVLNSAPKAVRFSAWAVMVGRSGDERILRFHTHRGQAVEMAVPKKVATAMAREVLGLRAAGKGHSTNSGQGGVA